MEQINPEDKMFNFTEDEKTILSEFVKGKYIRNKIGSGALHSWYIERFNEKDIVEILLKLSKNGYLICDYEINDFVCHIPDKDIYKKLYDALRIGEKEKKKEEELKNKESKEGKENMQEIINNIKEIMISVSTGGLRIEEINDEYKNLYNQLDKIFRMSNIRNPNNFSDLWEFYNHWKKNLATYAERRAFVIGLYKEIKHEKLEVKNNPNYVDLSRIKELKLIKDKNYDVTKLIKYCEELNLVYVNGCYLSVAMLVRAIMDHVPPIFGFKTFNEVVNNYKSPKSFKDSMCHLEGSCRKIADSFLHTQIREKEVLPNSTQVNFSNDLDVLLSEIYRILK